MQICVLVRRRKDGYQQSVAGHEQPLPGHKNAVVERPVRAPQQACAIRILALLLKGLVYRLPPHGLSRVMMSAKRSANGVGCRGRTRALRATAPSSRNGR